MLVVLGLYVGIFLYYSRRPPWLFVGLGILILSTLYLAVSLKYWHPTSLAALNITSKRVGLYFLVGLILILPGWFFDSLVSHLTGKGWISLGVVTSPCMILSIVAVATSEEIFFRGYLLGRLKILKSKRWVRIPLVCVLFTFYKVLIHSWEGWPFVAYFEFFVFEALKMLFETFWVDWTGSIVTPVVIHIGWDLIMFQAYATLPYWAW